MDSEQLIPENAQALILAGLKQQMIPNYVQTMVGITNPKGEGYNANGKFDPYITNNNNEYQVNIGYSRKGTYKTLEEAKIAKKDILPIDFEFAKTSLKEEYIKSEAEAKKIINKKHGRNAFQNLPIKSQFVIQDYIRTGDTNEKFFDAVVNNNFSEAINNYQRKHLGNGSELFRNVMFNEPMNENDFGNKNQATNYAKSFIKKINPNASGQYDMDVDGTEQIPMQQASAETFAKGGKKDIQAEFTGNELVNNKESEMRKALNEGNNKKAANIFKNQVTEKNITPGEASHKSNPLPVAKDGTVLNKNGKNTGIKAKDGAGVYDHISEQYNDNMSSDQIVKMIKDNHAKWRKNNMG